MLCKARVPKNVAVALERRLSVECPRCEIEMERQDTFEYNGLYRKMIPSATYWCEECGDVYYWIRGKAIIPDVDNHEIIREEE